MRPALDRRAVTMDDFEEAKDKVLMGKERRSMVMTEQEKRNTAYHEAGHALVAYFLPDADPLHKVTIIPRGRALGVTMQLPKEDKYNYTKEYMQATITICWPAGQPRRSSWELRPRAPPMTWNAPPASPARWFANGE